MMGRHPAQLVYRLAVLLTVDVHPVEEGSSIYLTFGYIQKRRLIVFDESDVENIGASSVF